ncbi:MAG: SPFH domain-containing protein [Clostridia bacterium]|nr:SPFH domain-containing protein [Clostridia bacterium]
MGLIKAAGQAIGSTFGDQFLSGISCEDMGNEILMVKKEDKNGTIAKGSRIMVAPGQVAVLYDSGKILDATAEPGIYTFDASTTPSFFAGQFGPVFKEMWERFKFGGAIAKEQAVFFFNAKEIVGNKFGTPNPVPYRDWGHALLNARTGGYTPMRLDIKCYGTYTFRIVDPATFMMNIAGNAEIYKKTMLVEQMRSEVVASFTNVLNSLSEDAYKIEALALPNKTDEIKDIMAKENFDGPITNRGISIVSFAVESVTLTEESKEKIDKYELAGDQFQQQGVLTDAYANAVQKAAGNSAGAMTGFMGMGMMNVNTGNPFGTVTANVANTTNYATPNQEAYNAAVTPNMPGSQIPNTPANQQQAEPVTAQTNEAVAVAPNNEKWVCKCGAENEGKFCTSCGMSKVDATKKTVTCPKCNSENAEGAKFCGECGQKLV